MVDEFITRLAHLIGVTLAGKLKGTCATASRSTAATASAVSPAVAPPFSAGEESNSSTTAKRLSQELAAL